MAEIARRNVWGGVSDLAPAIDALSAMAEAGLALGTAAGLREARFAMIEVGRLKRLLPDVAVPAWKEADLPPLLTDEEWLAMYAPKP